MSQVSWLWSSVPESSLTTPDISCSLRAVIATTHTQG